MTWTFYEIIALALVLWLCWKLFGQKIVFGVMVLVVIAWSALFARSGRQSRKSVPRKSSRWG